MIPSTNPMLARGKILNGSNLPLRSAFSSSANTPPSTLKPAKARRFQGLRWLHGALLAFFALLLCAGVALAQTGGGGGPGGGAGGGTSGGSTAAGSAGGSGNGNGGTGNGAAGGNNSNAGASLGSAATSLGSVGTGGIAAISSQPLPGGGTRYSLSIQTLLLLAALSFLPAALLLMTGFTRIVIVLSLLRSALGLQGSPPNPVLIALALFMTFYVMSPVFDDIYQNAYRPLDTNQITFNEALSRAEKPLKAFMLKQTRQADLALFLKLSNTAAPQVRDPDALPLSVVVPAFVTSELKTAFQIGFMIFLPFLIIDLVVASVLMSMGMMMLSPVLVSLPIKLMLFVLADGWNLLIGSLVASFNS